MQKLKKKEKQNNVQQNKKNLKKIFKKINLFSSDNTAITYDFFLKIRNVVFDTFSFFLLKCRKVSNK